MKKLILSCCIFFATYYNTFAQLKVLSNGNVGINNSSPAYRLDIEGTGRFSNWTDVLIDWTGMCGGPVIYPQSDWYLQLGKSDKRIGAIFANGMHISNIWWNSDDSIKTNKVAISNPLGLVQQLNGKKYNYTSNYLSVIPDTFQNINDYTNVQYGFMAREVFQVMPELVSYDSTTGIYSLNYIGVIPILTEAIKAQQTTINSLQNSITQITTSVTELSNSVITLQNCCDGAALYKKEDNKNSIYNINGKQNVLDYASGNSSTPILYQNNPNPFNDKTEIKYYLPASSKNVKIIVYNLNGQQLLANTINNNGQGLQSINIDGGGLAAGSYYYTLLVDNVEIDTKKMILYK